MKKVLPVEEPHEVPGLAEAWSKHVSWMVANSIGFYLPGVEERQFMDIHEFRADPATDEVERLILWNALPQRIAYHQSFQDAIEVSDTVTAPYPIGTRTKSKEPVVAEPRMQSEYCEWRVARDEPGGAIRKVTFTTETVEYFSTMYQVAPRTVVARYHQLVGEHVAAGELAYDDVTRLPETQPTGEYNPYNRWNMKDGLVHMISPDNPLHAAIGQCVAATVSRVVDGRLVTDGAQILGAMDPDGGAAGINDAADLAIVGVVGSLARAGAIIALDEPAAIILLGLDTRCWEMPAAANGRRPSDYWHPTRSGPGGVVRAEYHVPADSGFSISDIRIRGVPIRHGAQIAQCVTCGIRLLAKGFGTRTPSAKMRQGVALRDPKGGLALTVVAPGAPEAADRDAWMFPEKPTKRIAPLGEFREPVLDDHEIQGNVLAGFKKPHQLVVGYRIVPEKLAAVRRWIAAQPVSPLSEVADHNDHVRAHRAAARPDAPGDVVWLNLAFSHAGIKRLRPEDAEAFDSLAFRAGIGRRDVVPQRLDEEPDVLAVFGTDHAHRLPTEEAIRSDAADAGLEVAWLEVGVNPGSREHFGFRDGVSQPAVRGLLRCGSSLAPRDPPRKDGDLNGPEEAKPGQVLVWPGEFVLGYDRQSPRHPREPAPALPCTPEWTKNGSYLVFLKLEQDVEKFEAFVAAHARKLGVDADEAAALLVGRKKTGQPLMRPGGEARNDFDYDSDPHGKTCPLTAHIRKANPRDDTTEMGSAAATLRRRILRRGVPYGAFPHPPDGGKCGLLFMAYQASIEEQFEFLMNNWLRDAFRPVGPGCCDHFIGADPGGFVTPRAGGYFFTPSLSGLRRLAEE